MKSLWKSTAFSHYLAALFIKGNWSWRNCLETAVTKKRDKKAALKLLSTLLSRYGIPHQIVTDKLGSYKAAMRNIRYSGHHETGKHQNNLCENSHLHFRRPERAMKRFRSMKSLQKFVSIQAAFHNHFQHQRHLETRFHFKQLRSQSHAQWPRFTITRVAWAGLAWAGLAWSLFFLLNRDALVFVEEYPHGWPKWQSHGNGDPSHDLLCPVIQHRTYGVIFQTP